MQRNFVENIDIGIPVCLGLFIVPWSAFLLSSPRNVDHDSCSVFLCLQSVFVYRYVFIFSSSLLLLAKYGVE